MNGPSIRRLREGLALNPFAFAEVIGVHVSTLYRWEQSRAAVSMDPLQARILDQLSARFTAKQGEQQRQLGEDIKKALLVGGALLALALLLNKITE